MHALAPLVVVLAGCGGRGPLDGAWSAGMGILELHAVSGRYSTLDDTGQEGRGRWGVDHDDLWLVEHGTSDKWCLRVVDIGRDDAGDTLVLGWLGWVDERDPCPSDEPALVNTWRAVDDR